MQRNEDRQIYAALVEAARQGRSCALATVIGARGSTPREVGTKMLIDPDHGLVGTVGGGCGEAEVIEAARRVIATGQAETVRVDLTEDLYSWSPAVCGGIMNVFVEPVNRSGAKVSEGVTRTVRIRYRRPPDREDIFVQKILLDAADVKVTLSERVDLAPIRVHGRTICEPGADIIWFTFPGAWYDVGRFHLTDGTFTGFYTNVLTPPTFDETGGWTTTDLFLDVWLDAAGEVTLLDEDQLEEARAQGWVDAATGEHASAEASRILGLARSGQWPPPIVAQWTLARVRDRLAKDG